MNTEIQQTMRTHVMPRRRITSRPRVVIHVPTDSSQTGDSIRFGGDMECDGDRRKKVASVARVSPRVHVAISTSSLLQRAVAEAHKSLLKSPLTKMDKEIQKIVTRVPEDNSQEKGDNIRLRDDTDSNDDKNKNDIRKPSLSKAESSPFIIATDGYHTNAFLTKKLQRRLSTSSVESETEVIIKKEEYRPEKRITTGEELPMAKKRKTSPIVFDEEKNHSDSAPPLSSAQSEVVWCWLFPACRYGSACTFAHPRCKFLAACRRQNCFYSHSPNAPSAPSVASHVVPGANYNSMSAVVPYMCRFYPNCVNPVCHFYHPKSCRYGNNCANKEKCNFNHSDVPPRWRYCTQSKYKIINNYKI